MKEGEWREGKEEERLRDDMQVVTFHSATMLISLYQVHALVLT